MPSGPIYMPFRQPQFGGMYAAGESCSSLTLRQAFGNETLGMTGRRFVVIPNAVRDLYVAFPAYNELCEQLAKSQFVRM